MLKFDEPRGRTFSEIADAVSELLANEKEKTSALEIRLREVETENELLKKQLEALKLRKRKSKAHQNNKQPFFTPSASFALSSTTSYETNPAKKTR